MTHTDFLPVVPLMREVGGNIKAWRTDITARKLYNEADFKTEADRRAHDLLVEGLGRLYPGVNVISEEDGAHNAKRPDAYWLIDPIDGTASWYHGFDGFVTQAAYIEHNTPRFGIVHAPVLKKTWTAVHGCGARLNNKPLPKLVASDRLILADNTNIPHGIVEKIMSLLPSTGYLESGSLGLKSVLVADGIVDLFVKDVCVRDWDLAPAAVVLDEVGGCLSLATGAPYVFDGPFTKTEGFVVARDPVLMKLALEAINQIHVEKA